MNKVIIILLIFLAGSVNAEPNVKLVREALPKKISSLFNNVLHKAGQTDSIKVWVFFTDKGIFSQGAYRTAVNKISERFTEQAVQRRLRRKGEEPFDFNDLPVSDRYISQLGSLGFDLARTSRWLNGVSGYVAVSALENIAELSYVYEIRPVATGARSPEPPTESTTVPFKQSYDSLDYGPSYNQMHQINAIPLQEAGFSGRGVTVAILDSGFDIAHPAFDSLTFIAQYDFVDDDPVVLESQLSEYSHGTRVLSTLGGFSPGSLIGPAYNASIILARTEYDATETQVEEDNWIAAAEWADSIGVDIITSSLGYFDWYTYEDVDGDTAPITNAADLAVSRGIAVFISAGNERNKSFFYVTPPADGDSVIAVGAVDPDGVITSFSSSGPTYDGRIKPDIVAQGSGVICVTPGTSGFTAFSGTSASTPIASGCAALLLEVNRSLTPMELRQAMIESADRFDDPGNLYGYGLFDTYRAADLIEIDPIAVINLVPGDTLDLTVTVSGQEDSIPVFTAENLPATAVFVDNNDRTASLSYIALESDAGFRTIRFIAAVGGIRDTLEVQFQVLFQNKISAGPNPFRDSVSIFLGENTGQPAEISIFAINGEKVWETSADINYGTSPIVWRGVNTEGERVAPGVYLVYVRAGSAEQKIKLFKK